jgi:hypothetical protein
MATAIQGKVGDAIGGGLDKLGDGIEVLGEGVTKIGEVANKVPLVGAGMRGVGEGLSQVGETLHTLPRMARTRRGRVLVRSMLVGFTLVFAWIAAIVAIQLHGDDTPDLRPLAERTLLALSGGNPARLKSVFDAASPRFQEMVREERFVDDMIDMDLTVGRFREITAVNDTIVSTGPTGPIARVSLTVQFEKARCKASVSFHWIDDQWRLLGVGVELPPELAITNAERAQRIKPSDDVRPAVEQILAQLRGDEAAAVWRAAAPLFRGSVTEAAFVQLEAERRALVGRNKRIVAVTEAREIAGSSTSTALFDALVEYDGGVIRSTFKLERASRGDPWQLLSYKVVMPVPRADVEVVAPAGDGGVRAGRDAGVDGGRR